MKWNSIIKSTAAVTKHPLQSFKYITSPPVLSYKYKIIILKCNIFMLPRDTSIYHMQDNYVDMRVKLHYRKTVFVTDKFPTNPRTCI